MTETILSASVLISKIILMFAAFITFVRLARGPRTVDSVTALDLLAMVLMGMMFLHATTTGQAVMLDAILALAMISFLSTIGFARYLAERRQS